MLFVVRNTHSVFPMVLASKATATFSSQDMPLARYQEQAPTRQGCRLWCDERQHNLGYILTAIKNVNRFKSIDYRYHPSEIPTFDSIDFAIKLIRNLSKSTIREPNASFWAMIRIVGP
jgi:hypothetical protein